MKLASLLLICLAALFAAPRDSTPAQEEPAPVPVLVELFTSEGCNTCPPAERYLNEIVASDKRGAVHLIPIAYHVDYWDKLGWKDRFSQAAFTARQQEYRRAFGDETVYTPQMVVAGREGITGSDRKNAEKLFAEMAAKEAPQTLTILLSAPVGGKQTATVRLPEGLAEEAEDRLYFVWTQGNLKTEVAKGENRGKTLTHQAVALALAESPVQETVNLAVPQHEAGSPLRLVAFIQNKDDKRVKAVGEVLAKNEE